MCCHLNIYGLEKLPVTGQSVRSVRTQPKVSYSVSLLLDVVSFLSFLENVIYIAFLALRWAGRHFCLGAHGAARELITLAIILLVTVSLGGG